jgi:signal transduction histidine kinase
LGLLIVKEIVGAHGGTVRAESEGVPGQGTTFTVSIPLEPVLEG